MSVILKKVLAELSKGQIVIPYVNGRLDGMLNNYANNDESTVAIAEDEKMDEGLDEIIEEFPYIISSKFLGNSSIISSKSSSTFSLSATATADSSLLAELFNMSSNLPSSEGMTICPFDDSVEISFRITNFFSVF
ncbi:hypothetical protein QL285_001264 [Trifolium repens]|jgi:hypothetical protein|nr:hypothetical protein QL285_001264 [Trifolium repens]